MTYKGINKERFVYLLRWAIEPKAIERFLTESKAKLILAGAKADNLPVYSDQRIEFVSALPDKAHKILHDWLLLHLGEKSDTAPEQIVFRFLQTEIGMRQPSVAEKKDDARALLRLLLDDNCPDIVLKYLETPIGGSDAGRAPVALDALDDRMTVEDVRNISAVMLDDAQATFKPETAVAILVAALVQAERGNEGHARQLEKRLAERIPDLAEEVARSITKVLERSQADEVAGRGVVVENAMALDTADDLDPEDVDVVGYCSNVLDGGARFIEVIGLRDGNDLIRLTSEQAKQLFPETGDVMEFPATGIPSTAEQYVLNVWRVQRRDVGKPTKFRVVRRVSPVYDVIFVPHDSTDPDRVREWLIQHKGTPTIKALFQLRDGLIVKPPTDAADLSHFDFERPFDAWYSLVGVNWQRRVLVVGALSAADSKWECPPIGTTIRKLLKTHGELEEVPNLSKHQVQALCRFVEQSGQQNLTLTRIDRVRRELLSLGEQHEALHDLTGDLLNVPSVREQVDAAKSNAVEAFKASKIKAVAELEKLSRQREVITKEIERKKEELKQQTSELVKAIRKAFENAKSAGINSLAQVALFQALLTKKSSSQETAGDVTPLRTGSRLLVAHASPYSESVNDRLLVLGFTRTTARRWAIATQLAAHFGYAVAFGGSFGQLTSREVACCISKRRVTEIGIPVGLIDGSDLQRAMRESEDSDVILLTNANISAMEAYAQAIIEPTSRRLALGSGLGANIILSLVDGPSALPTPTSITAITFRFDTDRPESESFNGKPDDLVDLAKDRLIQVHANADVWLRTLQRFSRTLTDIEDVDVSAILGLVKSGLVAPYLSSLEIQA